MRLYSNHLDSIPLLPYTLLYAAGIVVSPVCGSISVWIFLFAAIIFLFIVRRPIVATWTSALLLGIIGATLARPANADVDDVLASDEFSGYITSVKDNDKGTSAVVRLSSPAPRQGSVAVKIFVTDFNLDLTEGMDIRFGANLTDQYQQPDLPFETDYARIDRRNV
ncbi:MAG: hypothetical protein K2H74_05815, partial [Paramuribaculum sp.]|nr:hypothetical protein [Paramuribaculum sp.]